MLPFLLATLIAQGNPAPECSAASLAVTSVAVANVRQSGALNDYLLKVTVANHGANQAGNVLQSIGIYRNGVKADQKSVPPLKAGARYSFSYSYERNTDAANGTTDFTFRPDLQSAGAPCYGPGSSYRFSV